MASWVQMYDVENSSFVESLVKAQQQQQQQQRQQQHLYLHARAEQQEQHSNNQSYSNDEPLHFALDSDVYCKKNMNARSPNENNNHNDHFSSSNDNICSSSDEDGENKFDVVMMAMPHTASTTTDFVLKARHRAWNVTLPLEKRGFTCHHSSSSSSSSSTTTTTTTTTKKNQKLVIRSSSFSSTSTHDPCRNDDKYSQNLYNCITGKLKYRFKEHTNYDILQKFGQDILFTTIRHPEQTILSHYKDRDQFDWTYKTLYPQTNLSTVSVEEWATNAWYRHNLFVKTFATPTQLIFRMHKESDIAPTKEENDYQISLGEDSTWLQIALQRLEEMPFFGLFHRLDESFELFGFHLCVPVESFRNRNKHDRVPSSELRDIVKKYYELDIILFEKAESLFDQLVLDMRKKKERGMMCDLRNLLGEKSDIRALGLMCVDDLRTHHD